MKYLLLLSILFAGMKGMGQKPSTAPLKFTKGDYPIERDSGIFIDVKNITPIWSISLPERKTDTIPTIMLVCDTSFHELVGFNYEKVERLDTWVYWQFGYYVERAMTAQELGTTGAVYIPIRAYLDENKKPLPKNIYVWMANRIETPTSKLSGFSMGDYPWSDTSMHINFKAGTSQEYGIITGYDPQISDSLRSKYPSSGIAIFGVDTTQVGDTIIHADLSFEANPGLAPDYWKYLKHHKSHCFDKDFNFGILDSTITGGKAPMGYGTRKLDCGVPKCCESVVFTRDLCPKCIRAVRRYRRKHYPKPFNRLPTKKQLKNL